MYFAYLEQLERYKKIDSDKALYLLGCWRNPIHSDALTVPRL